VINENRKIPKNATEFDSFGKYMDNAVYEVFKPVFKQLDLVHDYLNSTSPLLIKYEESELRNVDRDENCMEFNDYYCHPSFLHVFQTLHCLFISDFVGRSYSSCISTVSFRPFWLGEFHAAFNYISNPSLETYFKPRIVFARSLFESVHLKKLFKKIFISSRKI
jgi:hypothetical protein